MKRTRRQSIPNDQLWFVHGKGLFVATNTKAIGEYSDALVCERLWSVHQSKLDMKKKQQK